MFLSNRNEIWPMILQKAMAKIVGSYFALNSISPTETLEALTGWYAKKIPIKEFHQPKGLF